MAIEDEIINIAELDVGTELLRTDKLLVETSNGTKLLDFKDFIIGPDNISTVREDQIEMGGPTSTSGTTVFDNLSGFEILTTETSSGLRTSYRDLSGTVELTRRLAKENTVFGEMSATIATNESDIATLKANLASITTTLRATSALSAVSIITKSTNFKVNAESDSSRLADTQVAFNATELDASATNSGVVFTIDPISITYPDDGSFMSTWITYLGLLRVRKSGAGPINFRPTVTMYKKSKDGTPVDVFSKQFQSPTEMSAYYEVDIMTTLNIKPGDTITLETDSNLTLVTGSNFSGVQLGN